MKRLLYVLAALVLGLFACRVLDSTAPSAPASGQSKPAASDASPLAENADSMRDVHTPKQLLEKPDRIVLTRDGAERVLHPGAEEFGAVLDILEARLPDAFDEAAGAFVWRDENGSIDWAGMAQDFDSVRLVYHTAQHVKIHCMHDRYSGYAPELRFQNLTFPLQEIPRLCIVESGTFLGALEASESTLEKLAALFPPLPVAPEAYTSETPALSPDDRLAGLQEPDTSFADAQALLHDLSQTLTDEQHGGLSLETDWNGSGLATHGGPDRPEPYVVAWTVDKDAVQRAVQNYTGREVFVVYRDADYSMQQLNAAAYALRGSEIAPLLNGSDEGYGIGIRNNRVVLYVTDKENKAQIDRYLHTFAHKAAVLVEYRPNGKENPVT